MAYQAALVLNSQMAASSAPRAAWVSKDRAVEEARSVRGQGHKEEGGDAQDIVDVHDRLRRRRGRRGWSAAEEVHRHIGGAPGYTPAETRGRGRGSSEAQHRRAHDDAEEGGEAADAEEGRRTDSGHGGWRRV
eukprot:CAMPEP_0197891534 /NCGR_PEP_ID=MMETSP1439-20131203/28866_1 /TAXON_ID=66791 /ORGANISM="Gonyaulax spinifera, Strain CCMP409" /LENGTH=132 /DNA_ID=CAMNT_0043511643 /DNA_START=19 /DNA_END=417 /DNA_ORIENTATION=-